MEQSTARHLAGSELDALLTQHLELVKRIAWRLYRRLPRCVEIEDLVQAGVVGLLEAHQRYEQSEQASFATFAGIRIRGAMLDEIRRGDWAPRSLHRATRALAKAQLAVERRTGDAAPAHAVAAEMGMALPEYRRLRDDIGLSHVISLDAALADQPGLEVGAGASALPDGEVEQQDMVRAVAQAAKALPEREQALLRLYYEEGENLRQIAERMQVSESRVCQLHARAIRRVRQLVGAAS